MKIIKEENIREIVCLLKQGRVVCLPTDTVYGFLSHAQKEKAVNRIFDIKKREINNPVGIFVKDISMAKRYAEVDEKQEDLLRRYWPGKITFIFKKRREFPEGIGTKDTIGIRVPDHNLFDKIFSEINFPLAQTSANISGRPAPLRSEIVIGEFKNQTEQPDLVFDAGVLPSAGSSTVIDLSGQKARVVRKGPVEFRIRS